MFEIRPTITVRNLKTGQKGRYRMDQNLLLIGRERSCFIPLEDPIVSRRHAEILREGNQFFLRDLKSENKTFLNDNSIPPEEKVLLKSGDLFRIGPHEFRFSLPTGSEHSDIYEATDSDILEVKMVKKLLKALDRDQSPFLEVVEGPEVGQRFALEGKSQQILVGRDPACEFRIDSDVISRKHARITRKWDTVRIEDLGSRNGVHVGKERIKQKLLKDGDRIYLGTVVLAFRNPQELAADLAPAPKSKEPPKPPPEPVEKKVEEVVEEAPPPETGRFSTGDILLMMIGLLVLLGAIWGIWKIL